MKHTPRLVTAALAVVCALGAGCSGPKTADSATLSPTARLVGATLKNRHGDTATFVFDVEVRNPYAVSLPVDGAAYTLTSTGQTFLTGSSRSRTAIRAHGVDMVNVTAPVKISEMANHLPDAAPGSTVRYRADVTLSITGPGGQISLPLSRDARLTMPDGPTSSAVQPAGPLQAAEDRPA